MKYLLICLFFLPFVVHSQVPGIEIKLKTGESVYTNSILIYSNYSNSYARINGRSGEKIKIDRIEYVQGNDKRGHNRYFSPITIAGFKRWGERTFISDRIKIYSTSSFDLDSPTKAGNIYIKDNQRPKDLKYKYLKQDLADHSISMDYLKKANGLRTAQTLLWTASVGLFVAGVVKMVNTPMQEPGSVSMPPTFLLAGAVNLTGWILEPLKKDKFREALQHYE